MSDPYEVGWGKPPKASQFRKGKSGNLRGRPPGSKDLLKQMRDELLGHIVTSDGKKVSKIVALMKALYAKALKGDVRAIKLIWNMVPALEAFTSEEREDERVRGARILQEAILETLQAVRGENDRKKEDEDPPLH